MNWQEIAEKYPKAYCAWWIYISGHWPGQLTHDFKVPIESLTGHLLSFFDGEEIYVQSVSTEAFAAAFTRAFESLEGEIKEKNHAH